MSVNDFKLDLVKVSKESTNSNYSVKITSYSLVPQVAKQVH